jgi:hypothetical protein
LSADSGLIDAKYQVLLLDQNLEYSKKIDLLKESGDEKLLLEKSKIQIKKISEALKKIKEEHNKTVAQLKNNKISSKEVIELVQKYGAEVYQIYTSIKSIQKT